jgi:uncharacterized protein (TIGR03067 family)
MKAGIALVLGASVLVAATVRAGDADKEKDDAIKKDLAALEGTWVITGKEFMGKQATKEEIDDLAAESELVIKDGKSTRTDLATKKIVNEATLKLDPTAKPKTVDVTYTSGPVKGTTDKAIYEIDGDTLKVCYTLEPGAERPTEFAAKPDGKTFVLTFKRVKK